jgi:hypothetical protein
VVLLDDDEPIFGQPMDLTVIDWNVNGAVRQDQPDLLAQLQWDVALLQEVTRATWEAFRNLGNEGVVAFDHLPPLADGGPRYACAIVVNERARLVDAGVLESMPSPERALTATAQLDALILDLCSWAAPPGVSWGDAGKGRQVSRFAAWLRDRTRPVVVGIDRNTPKWERSNLAADEWWNKWEPLLYGPERVHDLRDAWRDVLDRDPQRMASVLAERPEGPLAVTHVRRGIECRYDAIYVSPEFEVIEVEHLCDEAREAGSDHAAVRAVLRATANREPPRWVRDR